MKTEYKTAADVFAQLKISEIAERLGSHRDEDINVQRVCNWRARGVPWRLRDDFSQVFGIPKDAF